MKLNMNHRLKIFFRGMLDLPFFLCALLLIPGNMFIYLLSLQPFLKRKTTSLTKPRLLFGVTPIISIAYIARALKQAGYSSETAVVGESSIYSRNDFDHVLVPQQLPKVLRLFFANAYAYCFFLRAIWKYDIFHYYFDGGLLRHTLFSRWELFFLKGCGKKIVLLPYGSDAFVYDLIPNLLWRHALMMEYSHFGKIAGSIQQRIRKMASLADIVVGCLVHIVNLPRWDILPLTCYPVDTEKCQPNYPNHKANQPIRVAHACNHRGIKGTIFLINAVDRLKSEGVNIELDIIEKVSNEEALARINACDIYVDQLIFGYAQAALEALSFGKVVISALDSSPQTDLFRTFSYLGECPIISANIENIHDILKQLMSQSAEWETIGKKSRDYVEKRHSFRACADLYETIYQKIWWNNAPDLINFYHPLLATADSYSKSPTPANTSWKGAAIEKLIS